MRTQLLAAFVTAVSLVGPPAAAQQTDPPARVGRIASVSGTVSFHLAGADRWERASLNLPLTDGSCIWTEPGAAATIGITGDRIALDATTELDVDRLDEHTLVTTQPQGETYWRVLMLRDGDSATVQTPRGIVAFAAAGRYEVISGDTNHPTEITVLEGSAKVTGLPADVQIGTNQTLTITGDGAGTPFASTLASAVRDAFLQRMLLAERPPTHHVTLLPAVAQMTGSDILAEEGDWRENAEYGPVWYPPVPAGFVPYRDGRWAYVAPWGWTWVDAAPWGFAPSHYGRWAELEGRWGWVPGREWAPERPPVYAPALVAFIAGATVGSWVGWAPLGPHEAYRPAYQASPGYAEALNRPTGAVTNVTNMTTFNRQAITIVQAQTMVSSVNVAQAFRASPPPPATTAAMQAVQFRAPVAPTPVTVGATTAVLREATPNLTAVPTRPAAPGPAIAPAVASPGHIGPAVLGGIAAGAGVALLHPPPPRPGLPELRPNGVVRSAVPGAPFTPPPSGTPAPSAPAAPQPPAIAQVPPPAATPRTPAVLPRTPGAPPTAPERPELRPNGVERSAVPGAPFTPPAGPPPAAQTPPGTATPRTPAVVPRAPGAPPAAPERPESQPNGVVRSAVPGAPFTPPPAGTPAPSAPQPPPTAQVPPATTTPRAPAVLPRTEAPPPPTERPELRQAAPARPTPPRPEPAQLAPPRPEPAQREQVRPAAPRVQPTRPPPAAPQPAPLARIREPAPAGPRPAPVAFHPPPPRPAPPPAPRPAPARQHREEDDHRRP